jgi:hypothetical protein
MGLGVNDPQVMPNIKIRMPNEGKEADYNVIGHLHLAFSS